MELPVAKLADEETDGQASGKPWAWPGLAFGLEGLGVDDMALKLTTGSPNGRCMF